MRTLPVLLLLVAAQDPLLPERAKVEQVATGYRFTEGPAADADGNVWFTDIPNQRILKVTLDSGKVQVVTEESGRANGLMFHEGKLYVCEGGRRRVVRADGDARDSLAERWEGKRLNSPNDLDIDAKGGVYFTDPRYGQRDDMELAVEAVYYITPKGKLVRVVDTLKRPNGLVLSGDGKTLYVADNAARKIVAYDVKDDGTLAGERDFASMDRRVRGGPDGMTVDERGNVYAAGQGAVWVWDKNGLFITRIDVPENPSNCAFGGKDRKTLYITARTSLYRIRLNVRGK